MKPIFLVVLALILTTNCFGQNTDSKKEILFDGTDLSQWVVPDNNVFWLIEDSNLWAKSDPEKTGSILWTKNSYKNFSVQLDFKFGEGTVDSGIFMRGDDEKNAQIQIGESGSLKRDMTGSPYVPKLSYPVEAEGIKELLKMDDWNTMKATAEGNTYTAWLNGVKVMTYTLKDANLEGPIGIQLHPNRDMSIQFKNISVETLD
ncbi:DUF1080 domain-containing protein [Aurantibacter crassamenti]|uniref:3-keto-disaccharide hydrolase n=1 Tax=Aurantibacter crassamenti TaxID=1837375 RepID=UPI0019396C40|nr:DUF1080 domain-containing protein [Aurantibacter crassamenti]MBM1106504.1 DUF1080 domain-containing protein [Aurantibacter crassamenti]